ncbi:MAG: hypothetical protein U1D55_06850 [Phycisphaerae bacterium]
MQALPHQCTIHNTMPARISVRDAHNKTLASFDISWHRYTIVASCGMDPLRLCGVSLDQSSPPEGTVDRSTAASLVREVTAWCRAVLDLWQECALGDAYLQAILSEHEVRQLRSGLDQLPPDDAARQRVLAFFHSERLDDGDEGTDCCFSFARDIFSFARVVHVEAQRAGFAHVDVC